MNAPYYGQPAVPGPAPDNYLVWAILTTVLCCLPLGIVAIVKSNQVNSLWAQGQFDAAYKASQDAKKFSIWAAVAGAVVFVLAIILNVGALAAILYSGYQGY